MASPVVLHYVRPGHSIPGVPARDLHEDDVPSLTVGLGALVETGVYAWAKTKAAEVMQAEPPDAPPAPKRRG